jgi:hypothetical protein
MKQAVVFVFFGSKYWQQFEICADSIRADWNIFVITDEQTQKACLIGWSGILIEVINVPTPTTVFDMLTYRQYIDKHIDITKYDQIWYCDPDMLFKGNILMKYSGCKQVLVSNEPIPINNIHMCGCFSESEIEKLLSENAPAINGGFFMIPKEQYSFFDVYRRSIARQKEKHPEVLSTDQHCLNELFHCKLIDAKLFDEGDVGFPSHGTDGKYINHYIGMYRDKIDWMKSELNKLGNE